MKKYLIILLVLLMSGCTAVYNIDLKEGTINESFVIESEIVNADGFISLKEAYEKDKDYEVNGHKYELVYSKEDNKEILKGYLKHKDIESFKDSYLVDKCFRDKDIYIKDNILTVSLKDNVVCPYINKVDINLKTDRFITSSNANIKKKNKHVWNTLDDGIFLQVALDKESDFNERLNWLPALIRILIAAIIITIVIVATRFVMKKKNL